MTTNFQPGDTVHVHYKMHDMGEMKIQMVEPEWLKCISDTGNFWIPRAEIPTGKYTVKMVKSVGDHVPTLQTFKAADPEYGAVCGGCGEVCPDAEKKPGFKCWSCRS